MIERQERNAGGQRRFSRGALVDWYKKRIETWPAGVRPPSFQDDWSAAKAELNPQITRDAMRDLRKQYAPPDWIRQRRYLSRPQAAVSPSGSGSRICDGGR